MGSYTENPTIPSVGGTSTNNKTTNPTTSIMGSAGQIAIANGITVSLLLLFMAHQLELKGMEIENIADAAKAKADSQIQAGKDAFLGSLAQGTSQIVSGGFSAYGGYKIGAETQAQQAEYNKIKTESPQILNNLADEANGFKKPAPGIEALDEASFEQLKKNPIQANKDGLTSKSITDEQREELRNAANAFDSETTKLQQDLKSQIGNTGTTHQLFSRAGSDFAGGAGTLVKGSFDAEAAKAQAEGTMAEASQSMADQAQGVINSMNAQVGDIINTVLQTQTQVASATTVH